METAAGTRVLIVEQKGKDIWRGRSKSISDAIEAGEAGIGIDRVLLTRALAHDVTVIMVVIEEQRRIYLTPIADFSDDELVRTRANYQGRATRIVPYSRWTQKYLGPRLQKRKSAARQAA